MKRLGFFIICFFVAICCKEGVSPTTPDIPDSGSFLVQENVVIEENTELKACEILEVRQRRWKNKNTLILEVWPKEGVTRLIARFRINGRDIYQVEITPFLKQEIELPIECRDKEYKVQVWVEGLYEKELVQCDGSVYFEWKCKPKKPECSNPTFGGFYGERKWHGDRFDVYAGYSHLRGKGEFELILRRHRCASQLILGTQRECHPENWEDRISLDCFTGNSLQLVAKNQSSSYTNWCYTSSLYLNGNLKEIRRIN